MQPSEALPPVVSRHRYAFVDGLRGLAALSVAELHILAQPLGQVSRVVGQIAFRGGLGVYVFFVISGFVISHTLVRTHMTVGTAARFLVKRMARLDPPYWTSIVLVYAVSTAASLGLHHPLTLPSPQAILANVFYLQYLLGIASCADIYWTLCLEIQFYLLLVVLIGIKQRFERLISEPVAMMAVFGPVLLYSFLTAGGFLHGPRGTCFAYWYAFAGGVGAQRVIAGRGWRFLVVAVLAALGISLVTRAEVGIVVSLAALAISIGHVRGKLDSWLSSRPFQYLGKISYSLYLIHPTVGARATNLLNHLLSGGPAMRVANGVVGIGISVMAAHVFWRVVERPSIDLSRWVAIRIPETAPTSG